MWLIPFMGRECTLRRTHRAVVAAVSWLTLAVLMPVASVVASVAIAPERADALTVGLSTFAGSGAVGHGDATGTAATFDSLVDIARSPDGAYLYALDNGSEGRPNTIRKIDANTGAVTTLTTGGLLDAPTHITTDPAGVVYVTVTNAGTGALVKVAPDGTQALHLTGIERGSDVAFSPDGSDLYYVRNHMECPVLSWQCAAYPSLWKTTSAGGDGAGGTDLGAAGHFTRGDVTDMTWDGQGRLYLIWNFAGPSGLGAWVSNTKAFIVDSRCSS